MARATTEPRYVLLGSVVAAVLALGACGGDDDEAFENLVPDDVADQIEDAGDPGETEETEEPGGERELQPLRFLLPDESDPGEGFTRIPASCVDTEGYGAPFTFGVPDEWEATGRGSAGGGSALGSNVDIRFDAGDGEVEVEVDPDSRRPDGPVLDHEGEPWESFDYEISRGEDTSVVTFDTVATVTVGDQEVEIFMAEQDLETAFSSRTEHKARIETAELPNPAPGDEDGIRPTSIVVSILHDVEAMDLDTDTVSQIIESFAIPECSKEGVVVEQEIMLGEDVDGDGEISTIEDMRNS